MTGGLLVGPDYGRAQPLAGNEIEREFVHVTSCDCMFGILNNNFTGIVKWK